jgi:predicted MFS family arabinose efflux permease
MTDTRFFQVGEHSAIARLLLAFLGTAGLFYVNIMPALVAGLIDGLGFSNREAGLVGSANVYGAALGALCAVFLVRKLPWRASCVCLFLGLIAIDSASILVSNATVMTGLRFVHGFTGGLSVGIAFSVMARTSEADKTFGYLLVVQYSLGGLGIMLLPPLVPEYGTWVLFAALIGFSGVTLCMVPFLPAYPQPEKAVQSVSDDKAGVQVLPLALTLAALFLFQAANMGLFAYIIGMGRHYGLEQDFIGTWLAIASWVGVLGSVLVIFLSIRFGRFKPLAAGICVTILGTVLLHWSGIPWAYALANCAVGITWAFVIPYLLGMCAAFDQSGQTAALGGFASKMGLASGPAVAALLMTGDSYTLIINVAVAGLFLCLLVMAMPALRLDRQAEQAVSDESSDGLIETQPA